MGGCRVTIVHTVSYRINKIQVNGTGSTGRRIAESAVKRNTTYPSCQCHCARPYLTIKAAGTAQATPHPHSLFTILQS